MTGWRSNRSSFDRLGPEALGFRPWDFQGCVPYQSTQVDGYIFLNRTEFILKHTKFKSILMQFAPPAVSTCTSLAWLARLAWLAQMILQAWLLNFARLVWLASSALNLTPQFE